MRPGACGQAKHIFLGLLAKTRCIICSSEFHIDMVDVMQACCLI